VPVDCRIKCCYTKSMKLTLQLQLLPTADQKADLLATMARFNEAATFAARVGFDAGIFGQVTLHRLAYRGIRERFGLSSQMAVRAIAKAVECFQRDRTKCPVFKPRSAICYDRRVLSFKGPTGVSLWAMSGRLRIPFVCGAYQRERQGRIKGQADLVYREGKFFLLCTIDLPGAAPIVPVGVLGVDLGIVNIATTSDGETFGGGDVEAVRRKHNLQRKRLQKRGTKGAKKKLRRVAAKESAFRRHQNHRISKSIVQTAQRTGRGIACEELTGIRGRVTALGGDAKNRLSGWSFSQLYGFLAYKAELAGVPVVKVDPRNTSRTCHVCGHCERANRKSQAEFVCKACGHIAPADRNAAENISALGTRRLPTGLVDATSV
jgi:putative transposase